MNLLKRSGFLLAVFLLPIVLQSAAAQQNGKGDAVKGKVVFQESGCWHCHNIDSPASRMLRANGPPAPSLMGLYKRPAHQLADGTKHEQHTDDMLRVIVVEGTKAMPPRGAALSDEEVNDLLAYLHTL